MYVITVIPVSKGVAIEDLTYFSAITYPIGSFVQVSIRGKEKQALVIAVEKVKNVKTSVRSNTFVLQKIRRQKAKQIVTKEFVQACKKVANYYATTIGAVLFPLLPKVFFESENVSNEECYSKRPKLRGFIIPRVYQGLSQNRIEFYRTSIREAFAAGGSVFIMVPSIADGERVYSELAGGIEMYSYFIHATLRKQVLKDRMEELLESKHPVVVIATGSFLSIPRHDLTTLIIERESSFLYRVRARPFFDYRMVARELATELGGQLFLADLPVSVESIYKRELGEFEEIVTGYHRTHFPTRVEIVNLQGVTTLTKKPFRAIEARFLERMREVGERGGRSLLYVARRGLSPLTMCRDCSTVVVCNECGASVVLHKGSEENYFLCHSCGALRHARERCAYCNSWRLETLGIGVELVEKEIKIAFPERNVLVLSSDTTKTYMQAKKNIEDFYHTPTSILVGTEMALPYLVKHIPFVGVVSLDSLLSLASWNIYEKVATTLTRLREITGEDLLVQTRKPEADVLRTVLSGNFSGFYRSELRARKTLGYPPFSVIVKLSVVGTQENNVAKMEEATQILLPYKLVSFSRILRAPGGKYVMHGFLRIAREKWPDEELVRRLRSLSPSYTITIDPDSIL